METGSVKRVIILAAGILAAFLVANTLTNAGVLLLGLTGPAALVAGFVVYGVLFYTLLRILEKYAHIEFFGFDR